MYIPASKYVFPHVYSNNGTNAVFKVKIIWMPVVGDKILYNFNMLNKNKEEGHKAMHIWAGAGDLLFCEGKTGHRRLNYL